ncbi:hypothetical protein [Zavarzinia sp. CC-PAN008]|uniref:linalool dehydratase/isomerase domain-containing protein n=1 Tax=Zavarzinia sp. CC-PAN008 TaxID=3243332 RepID=UPI003F74519B
MSVLEFDRVGAAPLPQPGQTGPVTAARLRRTYFVYALACLVGITPVVLQAPTFWQAAGMGLFMPGAGFLAVGGWAMLLFPVFVGLFALSLVAWFWAGMVVAPATVWLGSALLAGAFAGPQVWLPGVFLAPVAALATLAWFRLRRAQRDAKGREAFAFRQGFVAESVKEVAAQVPATMVANAERELQPDQLAAARYLLDRALQPIPEWNGFDVIDQFQPAALRYQINHMGFALANYQGSYAPNFSGYLGEAQRNLIDKYLLRKVWGYWVYESCWGHLNFTNWDPANKDNIMLTGWFGMHVGAYMLNSGDRRYAEPGSLTFRLNDRTSYVHDIHTIIGSVVWNFNTNPFCLYPCEPNWIYPICNHYGMSSLAVHDRLFGTTHVRDILPRFTEKMDTEFTDASGTLIGLRSELTGFEAPFPHGDAGFAPFANIFAPARAQRQWAIARKELAFVMAPGKDGRTRITLPKRGPMDSVDPGNYRPGNTPAYASILKAAREFGEEAIADAALASLAEDCGETWDGGVLRYTKGSNLANVVAAEARLMRTGDFRRVFVEGPPAHVFNGPLLTGVAYPDVLVARAWSDGADLDLVLRPGRGDGPQLLHFERLKPGLAYDLTGDATGTVIADAQGKAQATVTLKGRTALRLVPRA